MSKQATILKYILPREKKEKSHSEKTKKSSRLEERTLRLKQEFNKYDTERAGYLDSYQLKRYLFDAFNLKLSDPFIKQLIHEKTITKDTSKLYFDDFAGFKKLIETNHDELSQQQFSTFSIEEHTDINSLKYKISVVSNDIYSLPTYSIFQKNVLQSLNREYCYLIRPRKATSSIITQNYYSSTHFDEMCFDLQQRNNWLKNGSSPLPFEINDMHIFEYFNPTLSLSDVTTTYISSHSHIFKHMILINLEDIIFECGFFEPLVISVTIYNNKTVEKQIETIHFFRPLSGLKQQPFMVGLEKIDKNEYWLFISIYRKDDGNDSVLSLYREGFELTESKKSKKQFELIEKIKKKSDSEINMIALQEIAVGCIRIETIKDKIVKSNIPFLLTHIKEEMDVFKIIKNFNDIQKTAGSWSVSFKLLNQPDVQNPLESYQVFDASQAYILYCQTPRKSTNQQRSKHNRYTLKLSEEAQTTINSPIKENKKPLLLCVQNLPVSNVMRGTYSLNNSLYFSLIEIILSRERKTTITMEISLCHSLDEEPYEALLLPNYTVRPEKKLTFVFRGNDRIISLMREIRVELPTPPPLDIFFLIKMIDDAQSFCFIKLFNENGDPLDSNVEHNFPVYKGSEKKFMHDAFNGKAKQKHVLRVRFTSTATFYPRYHVLHSLLNEENINGFDRNMDYVSKLDATVIAPYLFMLLDKMIEIIEQVSLFKIVPILKKFFSDEEIRPVILVDYINNNFSPTTLNIDIGKLPYRILKSICEGFDDFEEEEYYKFKLTFFFFQLFVRSYTVADDKLESRLEIEKLLSKLFGLISFRMDIHIAKKDMRGIFEINLNVAELMRDLLCIANRDFVCSEIDKYYTALAFRNSVTREKHMDQSISTIYEILRLDFLCVLRDYPMLVEVSCPTIHYTEIGSIYDISYQAHWLPTFIIRQCMYLVLNHSDQIKVMGALCLFEMIQRYDCGVAYQEHRKIAAEMFFPLILFFLDEFEQIKEWTYQVFSNSKSNFIPQQQTAIRALFICFFFVLNETSDDLRQFFFKNSAPTSVSKLLQILVLGQQVFKTLDHHIQGTQGLYDYFRSKLVIQSLVDMIKDALTIRTLYSSNSPFEMFRKRRVTIATKGEEFEAKKTRKRTNTMRDLVPPLPFSKSNTNMDHIFQPVIQSKDESKQDKPRRGRKMSLFERNTDKESARRSMPQIDNKPTIANEIKNTIERKERLGQKITLAKLTNARAESPLTTDVNTQTNLNDLTEKVQPSNEQQTDPSCWKKPPVEGGMKALSQGIEEERITKPHKVRRKSTTLHGYYSHKSNTPETLPKSNGPLTGSALTFDDIPDSRPKEEINEQMPKEKPLISQSLQPHLLSHGSLMNISVNDSSPNDTPTKTSKRRPAVPKIPSDEACPKPTFANSPNESVEVHAMHHLSKSSLMTSQQMSSTTHHLPNKFTINTNAVPELSNPSIHENDAGDANLTPPSISTQSNKSLSKSHSTKRLIPKLAMKRVENEFSRSTPTGSPGVNQIQDLRSSNQTRSSASIQINTPSKRKSRPLVLDSTNSSSVQQPINSQPPRFLFGMTSETPRTRQRRQTEGGVKTPRGLEDSYVSETAGINNEKVLNVYLYCMLTTIIGDIATLCFSRHEHEEIKKYVGEILGEFSLSLNQHAFVSDVAFLSIEKIYSSTW
ncbi:DOCKER domain-containing protein [Entamoeba marina]